MRAGLDATVFNNPFGFDFFAFYQSGIRTNRMPDEDAFPSMADPIGPDFAALAPNVPIGAAMTGSVTAQVASADDSVFINEIHYDNVGGDTGEFVEIANPAGADLTGWTIVRYNGSNGTSYGTDALTGSDTIQVVNYSTNGLQNGSPDGIALVDADGNVVQFLSYEGSFTATNGPANGMTSTDIGVAETSGTPVGFSLQLTGTGSTYGDFTWATEATATNGAANNGQTLVGPAPVIFINEFHYDNAGGDVGEFIEIAGTAGLDLTGYTIELVNGSNGTVYNTLDLGTLGSIDDEGSGFGAVVFNLPTNGLQNGSPDGFALVDPDGNVIEFLSYEGAITATAGAANGTTSTDVGVAETGSTPIGSSIQRVGTGTEPGDFTWELTNDDTPGVINAGQTIGTAPALPAIAISDVTVDEAAGTLTFTLTLSEASIGPVTVDFATNSGTATAGDDFVASTGTVSFTPGFVTETVTIAILDDALFEGDEDFTLDLSNPVNATIADGQGVGTIRDNDDAPPPPPQGPAEVFINEIHYDNAGGDVGEGVEIAGPAGTDLTGWSVALYNGNGGGVYANISLSGIIPDQDDGYGTLEFFQSGIQNGAPDGLALVDAGGNVVQFLSYEGTLTATDGPAAGMASEDIGVAENGSPEGFSLQLSGTGFVYDDFTWEAPRDDNFGAVNTGQDFVGGPAAGTIFIDDAEVVEGDSGNTAMVFNVFRVGGTDGRVEGSGINVGSVPGSPTLTLDDFASPFINAGSFVFEDGESFTTFTINIQGDLIGEPNEQFSLEFFALTGGAVFGDSVGIGTIINDDPVILQIGEIQGESHTSIWAGNEVTTTGIVTAVAANGFYMQDADGDGNEATSDGIFVFTGGAPTVVVGDGLTVLGTVSEFQGGGDPSNLTVTQLTNADITVDSTGNALPSAVVIGPDGITPPTETIDDDNFATFDPANDGIDFWESLEGMLVTVQNPVAVDSTNGFGELWTAASDGEGGIVGSNVSSEGLLVIDGGEGGLGVFNAGAGSDFNPERIQIDSAGELNGVEVEIPDVGPGALLNDVTGVVSYAFENYEVRPTSAVTVAQESTNVAEATTLVPGAQNGLSVATYNVLNLDLGDPQEKFDQLAVDIGVGLKAPDIVVLQEVQDDSGPTNDGTVSAQLTLEKLAAEIFEETGVQYSVLDNTFITDGISGGQPGGNIRVAMLYRQDRVELEEGSAFTITDDTGAIDAAFAGSRAPLGATFRFNGESVTVIGNHFTSKIGSDSSFSAVQPPANAGALARAAQAAAVNAFVDELVAENADANVVVTGDFNEFQFEEPMQVLQGSLDFNGGELGQGGDAVLENLTFQLAPEDRFSVLFQGNAQALDHVFATSNLAQGAQIDAVHLNTPIAGGASDHDPMLAIFTVGNEFIEVPGGRGSDDIEGTDLNDNIDASSGNDTVDGNGGDDNIVGGSGNDVLFGNDGDDTIDGGSGNDVIGGGNGADTLTGGSGRDTFVVEAGKTAADADTITDFRSVDRIAMADADGRDIVIQQNGNDTEIFADGVLVVTVLGVRADRVTNLVEYEGTPASIDAPDGRGRSRFRDEFDFDSFDFDDGGAATGAMTMAQVGTTQVSFESIFGTAPVAAPIMGDLRNDPNDGFDNPWVLHGMLGFENIA